MLSVAMVSVAAPAFRTNNQLHKAMLKTGTISLRKSTTQHERLDTECCYALCHYAECHGPQKASGFISSHRVVWGFGVGAIA
jgi:hypothetical protein